MKKALVILLCGLLILGGCSKPQEGTKTKVAGETAEETKTEEKKADNSEKTAEEDKASTEFEKVTPQVDEPIVTEETTLGDYTSEFLSQYVEGGKYYILMLNSLTESFYLHCNNLFLLIYYLFK